MLVSEAENPSAAIAACARAISGPWPWITPRDAPSVPAEKNTKAGSPGPQAGSPAAAFSPSAISVRSATRRG
jgi:hypothetical protein